MLKHTLKVGVKAGMFLKNGSLYSNYEAIDKERARNKPKRLQTIDTETSVVSSYKLEKEARGHKARGGNQLTSNPTLDQVAISGALTNKLTDFDVKDMSDNGWQFSPLSSPFVGLRVRCFVLSGRSYLDGTVNAELAASMNRGEALYHILLDNGVRMGVKLKDVIVCREFLLTACISITASGFDEALSPLYRDLCTAAASSVSDDQVEVECVWLSRLSGAAPFLLRRFCGASSASQTLGVPLHLVLRCCRGGALHSRGSTDSTHFNNRVSFRFKKTGGSSSSSPSPRQREVCEAVVRALLTTTLPVAVSPATLTQPGPVLGRNLPVVCLTEDDAVLREFEDLWHAAKELQIPVAGLKMALSACRPSDASQVVPFAGLQWRYVAVSSSSAAGAQVPIDVLRVMLLLQRTDWTAVEERAVSPDIRTEVESINIVESVAAGSSSTGDEMEVADSFEGQCSSEEAGAVLTEAPTVIPTVVSVQSLVDSTAEIGPTLEEGIVCLSLDDVRLFSFPSLSEACAAMGYRSELFLRLCCKGALQQYGGFRWSVGPLRASGAMDASTITTSAVVDPVDPNGSPESTSSAVVVDDGSAFMEVEPSKELQLSAGEKKVPITAKDLHSLANLFMRDYDPRLALTVPEDDTSAGEEEEDEDDDDNKQPTSQETARRLQTMRDEGWLFGLADSEYIGLRVRRFFPDEVVSDARIAGFLPAALNDGDPQWHLIHDDGDCEDVDLVPMLQCIEHLRLNLQAEPTDKPQETATFAVTALPLTSSSSSSRWGGATVGLTGTEVHDRNTEKLRVIATERRVVEEETIEEVLQAQYREDCAASDGHSMPPVSGLCSLVINIIKVGDRYSVVFPF